MTTPEVSAAPVEDEEKRGRFAAVYVIVAFVTIIAAYLSIRILRDIHPVVVGGVIPPG